MVEIREIGRYAFGTVRSFFFGLAMAIILATLQLVLGKNASPNEER